MTQEQLALREVAAEVARDIYAPVAAQWDAERTALPAVETKRLAELGFLGIALPERYGGAGGDLLSALLVVEELAKQCRPAAFQVFEANVGPARVIEFFGTEAQREWILPKVVSGDITMAIGISEPDAGSAATDMRTTARLEGDELVINGSKRWISNGGHADHYLVYCRLSDAPGPKASAPSSSPLTHPGSAPEPARSSWAGATFPRPISTSTTCGCRRPTSWSRPAVSASCSVSSRSNGWATRR